MLKIKRGAEAPLGILSSGGLFGREGLDGPEVGGEVGGGASGEDNVQRCKSAGDLCKSAKVKPDFRVRSTECRGDRRASGATAYGGSHDARRARGGQTSWCTRSVRSPDPSRDRYQRPKWPKERQDGPWRRVWGGGRGQATNIACKGANRPVACAKVQRLSQISEYRVLRGPAGNRTRGHGGGGTEARKAKGRERR